MRVAFFWVLVLMLLAVAVAVSDKARILLVSLLPAMDSPVKTYPLPGLTEWRPVGEKRISSSDNPNARQVSFGRALHTDTHGSDEISTVIAPAFEMDWIAEPNMFIAEGPVFDGAGNIYFCPVYPTENALLVSIEPEQGKRRWVVEGFSLGCGTPYVLIDPDTGDDVIYLGTYDRAMALTTDGDVLWDVPTGLPPLDPAVIDGNKHSFGMNYLARYDALVAVMGDGSVYVLDRKTGRPLLDKPYVMPGDKTGVTNFSLPTVVSLKANRDAAHMFGGKESLNGQDPISAVLHIAAGEKQKVTNFFSIDSNTGRLWIAATLPDEADGKVDGFADYAALYGLNLEKKGEHYQFEVHSVTQVPGGTASTPAVSADGQRIYIADAFDSVYAIDANTGKQIWSFNVGSKVTGSLTIAADNGEIYANVRTQIVKLFDRGDHAEKAWISNLDMFEAGPFQSNFKALGAEVGANGIAFTGAVGLNAGKKKFPLKIGAGILDRETGDVRYFVEGGEDSVSSMVTGPDGGLYIGNSPLRRVLARAVLGEAKSPMSVQGGITRFKPVHNHLIVRDALWAAAGRARNAATLNNPAVVEQDIFQIIQLLDQAFGALPVAMHEGVITDELLTEFQRDINSYKAQLDRNPEKLLKLADNLESMSHQL